MGGIEGQLVIGLSVLVLAWYFIGQQTMRRRGLAVLQWVRDGVSLLGDNPKLRWLGSAAFQLTLERPAPPFAALAVTVVLEPREILFLWLVNRLRRRRDLLVVRADLTTRPGVMVELFRPQGRSGKEAQALAHEARWRIEAFDTSGLYLAASSPRARDLLRSATQQAQDRLGSLIRLSIRDTSPHLLLNYTLRPGQGGSVSQEFRFLAELARALLAVRPL
jgi:hypothetical protein